MHKLSKKSDIKSDNTTTGKNGVSDPKFQNGLDKKLVQSLSPKKIPRPKQLKHLGKVLTSKELFLIRLSVLVIASSLIFLGIRFYINNFKPTPAPGGRYTEALVGAPQYINPLLSQTNDVDSDISKLVFSSLLKYDNNLNLVPDLATEYYISEDQKTYTFVLRQDVKWHDDTTMTADDVVFTVESILDSDFKSPLLPSLRGVEINKIDQFQVSFILPEPFPPFLEALTFGILPEHIWLEIPPLNANLTEYNLKPVGTGPWKFKKLNKDSLGNIKSYIVERNEDYYGQKPYLEEITFKFYPDFDIAVDAVKSKSVDGLSFLPKNKKDDLSSVTNINYHSFYLPQYTAIFFNQKQNEILKDKEVRKALRLAIDKPKILSEALKLEGEIIEGPILPGLSGYDPDIERIPYDPNQANQILEDLGWKKISSDDYQQSLEEKFEKLQKEAEEKLDEENINSDETDTATSTQMLTKEEYVNINLVEGQEFYRQKDEILIEITLTTVDQSENLKAAELIQKSWQEIGVKTKLVIVDSGKISREIIKPRNYQTLLFGVIAGADADPFPFWHSSQIQDPGLNLAVYANRQVDKILENARSTTDTEEKNKLYNEFQNIIISEIPAIFLFNPTYTYVLDQKIKGLDISRIIIPSDRFNNLEEWYIKTKRKYQK